VFFCFVFLKSEVQFSLQQLLILADVYRGFSQFLHRNMKKTPSSACISILFKHEQQSNGKKKHTYSGAARSGQQLVI
jgi:hypothetical protein